MNSIVRVLLLSFFFTFYSFSQGMDKKPTFGLQFKPLSESGFIGSSSLSIKNTLFKSDFVQTFGYSFGAIVRMPTWRNIFIETGLAQVQRNYLVNYSTLDSNFTATKSLSFINHDIPINALIFVKLASNFYLNTALGFSLVHNPSNVASQIEYANHVLFKAEGRKRSNFAFEFNVTTGIEYRNTKWGNFYIGASGRIPLRPIFDVATMYQNGNSKEILYGSLNGNYVAFDFRYFLPKTKKPKIISEKGPLDE
jgi:hypothetical protein